MDKIDKKILNMIQKNFPIGREPFKKVAEVIGIGEDEAIRRIKKMKDDGIIRRIGAVIDPRKLGFISTLCAARVPDEKVADFARTVGGYPGVTHNYRRNHEYNIWFTLIAESEESLEGIVAEISEKTGIDDILSLRAHRTFKIDASFKL